MTGRNREAARDHAQNEHGDVEHCSFLLNWLGRVVLVSGDVETVSLLLDQVEHLDFLLLPYWLAGEAGEIRQRFPDVRIVLSHQEPGENIRVCDGCERLEQGDSIAW